MNYLIYIILIFSILIFSLIRINNKTSEKIFSLIFLFVYISFTLYLYYSSINSIDSNNYKISFDQNVYISNKNKNLFYWLMYTVKDFGWSYQVFRLIIGISTLIPIIFLYLKSNTKKEKSILLLCSLIFPFFQNIVALRNTFACLFLFFSFWILLNKTKIRWYIISLLLLQVACFIHNISYIYYIVIFMYFLMRKNSFKTNLVLLLMAIIMIFAVTRIDVIQNFFIDSIGEKALMYFEISESIGLGFIFVSFLHLLLVFFIYYLSEKNYNKDNNIIDSNINLLNLALIIVIPFYSINALFFRLFRNTIVFSYFSVSKSKNNGIIIGLFYIMLIFLMGFDASGIDSIKSIMNY